MKLQCLSPQFLRPVPYTMQFERVDSAAVAHCIRLKCPQCYMDYPGYSAVHDIVVWKDCHEVIHTSKKLITKFNDGDYNTLTFDTPVQVKGGCGCRFTIINGCVIM